MRVTRELYTLAPRTAVFSLPCAQSSPPPRRRGVNYYFTNRPQGGNPQGVPEGGRCIDFTRHTSELSMDL